VTGQWFSPGTPAASINKTDCHVITEILLNVSLNTINQTINRKTSFDNNAYFLKHAENTRLIKLDVRVYMSSALRVPYLSSAI
jgi:hypothetical protein